MNTFISKILSLFFCCFVLGNAFAQDEVTYKGKLEDKTTNKLLNFNDFTITVVETGKKVKVDSLGQFQFTLPKECNDVNLSFQGNNEETPKNKYVRYLESQPFIIAQKFDDKMEIFFLIKHEIETGCFNLKSYRRASSAGFYGFTYFNKAMGM